MKKNLHIALIIITAVYLLFGSFFSPHLITRTPTAHALGTSGLVDIGVSSALCAFESQISGAITSLLNLIGVGDIISGAVDGLLPGGTVPVHVKKDDEFKTKDASDCIANGLKRVIITAVRDDFLDFLENNGDSFIIRSFEDELRDAADEAYRGVFSDLGAAGICPHNRAALEILLGGVISDQAIPTVYGEGFRASMRCSLADVLDLENGGWETFQEDYYAGGRVAFLRAFDDDIAERYFDARLEFEKRSAVAVRSRELQTQTGNGVRPVQQCPPGEEFTFPDDSKGCRVPLQIVSPASTIASQLDRVISAEFDNLVDADEWDEVLKGIISILAREFIEDGISSLRGFSRPTPALPQGPQGPEGGSGSTPIDPSGLGQISGQPGLTINGPTQLKVQELGRFSFVSVDLEGFSQNIGVGVARNEIETLTIRVSFGDGEDGIEGPLIRSDGKFQTSQSRQWFAPGFYDITVLVTGKNSSQVGIFIVEVTEITE